ncbi:hypothetical protein LAZ67_3004659 [Cordylochernes scorpioides]|uniref:Uncharacterized protein n=1 Tax=Cordylochernes scorpioides TaxID=51811 RepID=A0ABY6KA09_9ARAC|nr:hypothetical protein LAZ67_3004659 [Cordylochernes scorpioides]
MFSEGREDVNDEERGGRPSTSTTDEKINEVEKMILANRRITVREVAEDLNISIGSCHSIFINDLGMKRVAAKFVQKLLNCDQKQHRMNIANEMLDSVRDDPNLLQRVITGDEAGVYGYDVETKAQSSQWKLPHEPRPKKARQVRSNVKVLLTVFFDFRGVVHHEFLPQGRTVNKEYYLQVMRNLREAIRQKRPDLWKNKNWLLHHDNAPAHTSLLVRVFLAKNSTLMMPQPPYSPDLPPCDFFLFPKRKRPMKGRRYATLDEIKTASKEELKKIFKNDFLKCFEDWKNRWHNFLPSNTVASYFPTQSRVLIIPNCMLQLPLKRLRFNQISPFASNNKKPRNDIATERLSRQDSEMELNQDPTGVKSDGPTETMERRQEVRESESARERQEVTGRETTAPLADAINQLSTFLTRVKISDGAESAIPPFDGAYSATQFFQTFDRKMEDASMGEQEKLLRLPNYLVRQPLELFRKLRLADRSYFQVRQILLDLYPESSEASFAKYFAMKLTGQTNLETYYREKTTMGLQLGLPQEVILETLTEGLPFNDQRLVRVVPPENLGEWFRLVQRIHGPSVPATRSREDQPPTMSGPYHGTPRRPVHVVQAMIIMNSNETKPVLHYNHGSINSKIKKAIISGGEGFDDFGEHDIEELLVDEALNDDDILESMVDTTKEFETVDSELDVTPLDEKLLREGLQLSGKLEIFFIQNDNDVERALKFQRDLKFCMSGYRELYKELVKPSQRLITDYLVKEKKNH